MQPVQSPSHSTLNSPAAWLARPPPLLTFLATTAMKGIRWAPVANAEPYVVKAYLRRWGLSRGPVKILAQTF